MATGKSLLADMMPCPYASLGPESDSLASGIPRASGIVCNY